MRGNGIAVIGLYIAFIIPVFLRFRLGEGFQPGSWTLGKHYKWIDPIAIVWVFFICIVFLMPPYSISAPWKEGFTWEARQLRADPRRWSAAALRRLVGALREQLVQGTGSHGHGGGAEQLEEQQLGEFALPTEAS